MEELKTAIFNFYYFPSYFQGLHFAHFLYGKFYCQLMKICFAKDWQLIFIFTILFFLYYFWKFCFNYIIMLYYNRVKLVVHFGFCQALMLMTEASFFLFGYFLELKIHSIRLNGHQIFIDIHFLVCLIHFCQMIQNPYMMIFS